MKHVLLFFCCLPLLLFGQSDPISDFVISIDFCQSLAMNPDKPLIRGKLIEELDHGIKVEVLEVYRGSVPDKKITIWDGTPFRYYENKARDLFPQEAEEAVLLLFPIDSIVNEWDKMGDFGNSCTNWCTSSLIREGEVLKGLFRWGNVSGEFVDEVPLKDFVKEAQSCVETGWGPTGIYPNPATDMINIDGEGEIDEVRLWNILGQHVLTIREPEYPIQMSVSHLASGVYVLTLHRQGSFVVKEKVRIITGL